MVARTLITTADERTWPKNKTEPVLFLGEWCKLYRRKHIWENMDYQVIPYHWDDRAKLYNDYKYINDLYEKILSVLYLELNKVHGVMYSKQYWRILIGPWLNIFLSAIVDRWESIETTLIDYKINKTIFLKNKKLAQASKSMADFMVLVNTDDWNCDIYSEIIRYKKLHCISYIENSHSPDYSSHKIKKNLIIKVRSLLKKIIGISSPFFSRDTDYFFLSTYLSRWKLILLQIKLHQFPIITFEDNIVIDEVCFNENNTNKIFLKRFEATSDLELFLKKIIPLHIPICYLDGYALLSNKVNELKWPKKPKAIFTSNSHFMSDVFKLWAATKVEDNTPLFIGQHGGNYGQALFSSVEDHELEICTHYFTWGWTASNDKIIPIGYLKNRAKRKAKVSATLALGVISRYLDGIASMPLSSQWNYYFKDQINFYRALNEDIRNSITIRPSPGLIVNDELSQNALWKDNFPKAHIDNSQDFHDVLSCSKIIIYGWNSTTYLESIASNVPTIIFWRPKYFELKEEAKVKLDKLQECGVFHSNPISAAKHLNKIWDDIDSWWDSDEVVVARNDFINTYAASGNILDKLTVALRKYD